MKGRWHLLHRDDNDPTQNKTLLANIVWRARMGSVEGRQTDGGFHWVPQGGGGCPGTAWSTDWNGAISSSGVRAHDADGWQTPSGIESMWKQYACSRASWADLHDNDGVWCSCGSGGYDSCDASRGRTRSGARDIHRRAPSRPAASRERRATRGGLLPVCWLLPRCPPFFPVHTSSKLQGERKEQIGTLKKSGECGERDKGIGAGGKQTCRSHQGL